MRRSSGHRFSGNLQQRVEMEQLARGDREFIHTLNDAALEAALTWAEGLENERAASAVRREIEARKEVLTR